jgi:hypothetical protein
MEHETYIDFMAGQALIGLMVMTSIEKAPVPDTILAFRAYEMAEILAAEKEKRCKKTEQ